MPTYGDEQALLMRLPGAGVGLGGGLTEAMVRFAARYEYALTVEDVLARRARLLFLDAALAASLAPGWPTSCARKPGKIPKPMNLSSWLSNTGVRPIKKAKKL